MSKTQGILVAAAVALIAALLYFVAGGPGSPVGRDKPSALLEGGDLLDAGADPAAEKAIGLEGSARAPATQDGMGALPDPVDLEKADRERDLHGIVVRSDGTPVAGASLEAVSYPWRYGRLLTDGGYKVAEVKAQTRSARDGTFSLQLARGDHVHLRVAAIGLVSTELAMLQAGERVRVVLAEAVALIVRAKTPAGEPAPGLTLHVFRGGRGTQSFDYVGETDAEGHCAFSDLPPSTSIFLDPQPRHEGWGNPSWIRLDLPASGSMTYELALPEGRTLTGTVTDATTGKAVEGARVGMGWVMRIQTRTDAEGRYALPSWTGKGTTDIHVVAKGYARAQVDVEKKEVLDFALVPGVQVRGRVVDAKGRALRKAQVMVVGSERGGSEKLSMDHAWTDAEGRFALDSLSPELAHVLTVIRRGYAQGLGDIPPAGETREVDLGEIVLKAPRTLLGTLAGPDGEPVARVMIGLRINEPGKQGYRRGRAWERRSDDLGRFRFEDLPPGSYTVATRPDGGVGLSQQVQLLDRDEPTVVTLVQEISREVRIRVTNHAGKPVSGVYLQVRTGTGGQIQRQSDGQGYATLQLPPGEATVRVTYMGEQPYAPPAALTLKEGETEAVIVLEPALLTRGRLLDPEGQPLAWAQLEVEINGDSKTFVSTDADGAFRVTTKPGAVLNIVFAGKVGVSESQQYRTEQKPMQGKQEGVRAGATDVLLRATALRLDGSVVVRVLDPEGNPLKDLWVNVYPVTGRRPALRTGADGRVKIESLLVGELNFSVAFSSTSAQPWVVPTPAPFVPEGQEIVVQLCAGAEIQGTLFTAEGRPTPGYISVLRGTKSAGSARADREGRFVVVVDAGQPGPYILQSMVHQKGVRPIVARVEGVQPGDSGIELRYEAPK